MPLNHFLVYLLLLAISFLANFFSALAGGGAGLLQLPALIFLGMPFQVALATHKVASVALGVGATLRYLRERSLDIRFILLILIFGLPGVFLGAKLVLFLPSNAFDFLLGSLTLCIGIYSVSHKELGMRSQNRELLLWEFIIGGFVLFLIGFLNGSLTSGTGLFVTIWLVYWFRLDYSLAVAYTLVLVGLFWNGAGAVVLALDSNIKWNWLPILLFGSLSGGYIGSHVVISNGSKVVKNSFEILTLFVGFFLIVRSF